MLVCIYFTTFFLSSSPFVSIELTDFQTRGTLVTLAGDSVPGLQRACVGLRIVDSPDVELIESLTVEVELALVIRRNPAAFRGVIDILDDDNESAIFPLSILFTCIHIAT